MSTTLARLRHRSRAVLRRSGLVPRGPVYGRLVDAGRALPIPAAARIRVSAVLLRRPGATFVRFEDLLMGAQGGWTAREFAERTGDLLWPSTPFLQGPHVALLRLADATGELSDEQILATDYVALGRRCIAAGSSYFGADTDAGLVAGARAFIHRHRGGRAGGGPARPHQSRGDDPVLVAPVRGSRCYQVLDGHHRLAIAAVGGAPGAYVVVKRVPVATPLQDHLARMSWLEGSRELYQPLDAPELADSWTTVRRCTDRFEKMVRLLAERDVQPPAAYLDVASCYGWFVARMAARGFAASGMERDPLAVPLGRAAYGLTDGAVAVGDCVDLLRGSRRTWDVVSCFSLLHHFVLGRASAGPEELVRLLDAATGRVLFLDTGQDDEEWFRTSLRGWDPGRIARFLRENTTFDEVIDLGPDDDARPPYADNYGRHLFACVRTP